jgi:hypothetical protein
LSSDPICELFYLTGLLRDGSVYYDASSRNYYVVWYSKSCEFLRAVVAPKLSRVFPNIRWRLDEYKKGHWRIRISNKSAYNMLKRCFEFPTERMGQRHWGVPTLVREAGLHQQLSHITGIADAEGDVSLVNKYIEISQKNYEVLEWIKTTVKEVGIRTGNVILADKKSSTYKIVVCERKSVLLFQKLVNFEHPVKKTKLEKLVDFVLKHPSARRQQT